MSDQEPGHFACDASAQNCSTKFWSRNWAPFVVAIYEQNVRAKRNNAKKCQKMKAIKMRWKNVLVAGSGEERRTSKYIQKLEYKRMHTYTRIHSNLFVCITVYFKLFYATLDVNLDWLKYFLRWKWFNRFAQTRTRYKSVLSPTVVKLT